MSKEMKLNVNAEVCKERRVNQCRSLQGGEMLDRDEHAEAMNQVAVLTFLALLPDT